MCGLDLPEVEKGEVIPDSVALKSDFLFVENYYWTLSTNLGPKWLHKELELTDGFCHLLLEWSFLRNKSKIKRKLTTQILPS